MSDAEIADLLADAGCDDPRVAGMAADEIARRTSEVEIPDMVGHLTQPAHVDDDSSEAALQRQLANDVARAILTDDRATARRLIRDHYDPSWFVLEVVGWLAAHSAHGRENRAVNLALLGNALADVRRLLAE